MERRDREQELADLADDEGDAFAETAPCMQGSAGRMSEPARPR
jgi:hypothetical protein